MLATLTPYTPADLETFRGLVADPSLSDEFSFLHGPGGIEHMMADPWLDRGGTRIARIDGEPVGFSFVVKLRGRDASWCLIRMGVLDRFQRRGIGAQLFDDAIAGIRARNIPCDELVMSAWIPSASATSFALKQDFQPVRRFWKMERPIGEVPPIVWPDGITVRTVDGSEASLRDWNDAYLSSFANHWHFVASTLEDTRELTKDPMYRPDGVFLAYRGDRCVGVARNQLRAHEGELQILGTTPEARGIGLGRALLRQSVVWLQAQNTPRVVLGVDGENPNALALYRSEGFEEKKTRQVWTRAMKQAKGSGRPSE